MKRLLSVWHNGEAELRKINAPSLNSEMLYIRIDFDNKIYFYEYDNAEEMAREIEERYMCEGNICVFKLTDKKDRILAYEIIKDEELSDKEYSDWYVLYNGMMKVKDYLKDLEG